MHALITYFTDSLIKYSNISETCYIGFTHGILLQPFSCRLILIYASLLRSENQNINVALTVGALKSPGRYTFGYARNPFDFCQLEMQQNIIILHQLHFHG